MSSGAMGRREALGVISLMPLAALDWGGGGAPLVKEPAARSAAAAIAGQARTGAPYTPAFFTSHEWETVRILADLIIPRDERSGSATDAGVPEFIDFMMTDRPQYQTPMRGGLAWLDAECGRRFGKTFVASASAERRAVLDDIAWPARAKSELSQGVAFFNRFRDLTASGFFSSKMGVEDLQYRGNTVVAEWAGCPDEALARLGVSYGEKREPANDQNRKG